MKKHHSFDWKGFIRRVALIAIPVALQNLLTTTGTMVDTVMIAPLGETTVGAVGLCAQFASLMFSCYWGFVGGSILFFSQYWGALDYRGINRTYGTTMCFLLSVGVLFFLFGRCFPDTVMSIYTDKPALQEIGTEYLSVAAFAYPLQIISVGMSTLLRSTERVKIPLFAAFSSVLSNILLNWILIYGKCGLPAMGVRGAALATVCAAGVNLLFIVISCAVTRNPFLFRVKEHFTWHKGWFSEYLGKCFPILCNEMLYGIGLVVINLVLGRQSEDAIAAIAVFNTLAGFVIAFFSGFSSASSIIVGKHIGAGELEEALRCAKRLVYLCAACIFVVCVVLFSVHGPVLSLMHLSGNAYSICVGILALYCVGATIRMCNWVQNDTYRAGGDPAFGAVMEISFLYALVIPCVCLAGLSFHADAIAVVACTFIDEPIRFVIMQRRMYSGKWINPVTEEGRRALPAFCEAHGRRHGKKRKKAGR